MLGDVNLGVGMEQCGMGMTEADISLGSDASAIIEHTNQGHLSGR